MSHARCRATLPLVLLLLTTLACTTARPHPPAATPTDAIHTTARLRPGVRPPADATLHITVRSAAGYIYGQHTATVRQWPVHVSIPVSNWPTGKGDFPLTLWITARAEAAGRDVLITESDTAVEQTDTWGGKQYELILHPTME
jgi:hypothetical protein